MCYQIGARKPLCYPLLTRIVILILVLKGKGKFINRPTVTGGKKYDKYFVYIPTKVANDSQFPFKQGDTVMIKVDPKQSKVILEKAKKSRKLL